jgi:replicative DNA helicase
MWLVDSAVRSSSRGIPTFVFSAETAETGLRNRLIANVAGIDSKALRGERLDGITDQRQVLSASEWDAIDAALDTLDRLPLFLDFSATKPDHVLASIERVLVKHGIGFEESWVADFDYLTFAGSEPNETIEQSTSRASREFKSIAKLTNRPWTIFAQLVRQAEGSGARSRGNEATRQPQLTDFRGSGRIEQDADVAMVLTGERLPGAINPRTLWLLKQREGEVGTRFEFELEKPTSRWRQVQRHEAQVTPFLLDG